MLKRFWDYSKSFAKGIFIAFAVILFYSLFDLMYYNNQLFFADNVDFIKTCIVAISIVLYLILGYFFYRYSKSRGVINFILLLAPYFLILFITMLMSVNIPRMLDFVYITLGVTLLHFLFIEKSFINRHKYIFVIFLLFTIASYPFAYENINFVYHKSDDEKILVEGDFDFSIKDRLGKTIKLSELKNKIVCIDMWSSTCGGCIRSMPEFEKLNIYFKTNQDYRIISLFCPMKEHETYEWFLNYIKQDFNYNIDYYYIEVDEFKKLGIYQFPEFFLINKDNKIVYRGLITYKKTIKDNIYEMLEKINSNE
jgi:thiol-disulfide isomerase/thioredoxin